MKKLPSVYIFKKGRILSFWCVSGIAAHYMQRNIFTFE